ncbi:hypothetical protein [Anthocerotibacter panamensis]|uniref:hypothetical protein n=1 Tax=Anthocerotibacter panamensis TaxID=2857077 RepID=UPI001C4083E9|nr:hypothetical protein [Anthocerotibacter panamensis]
MHLNSSMSLKHEGWPPTGSKEIYQVMLTQKGWLGSQRLARRLGYRGVSEMLEFLGRAEEVAYQGLSEVLGDP